MMNNQQLDKILDDLLALPSETEWVEFKHASKDYSFEKIGKYFSAISNEANLKNQSSGWLVFGVEDRKHKVAGTQYRLNRKMLDRLKHEIAQQTTSSITFTEIYEHFREGKRILFFQIPAAPRGIPVSWQGHMYGRDGESLVALSLTKIEMIRSQHSIQDWSAEVCREAGVADLDPKAIEMARKNFALKFPSRRDEIKTWDDLTFLNKARITIKGQITNTAILLLGREESEHYLSPAIGKISWLLKSEKNEEVDYEHFAPPFLINVEKVYLKIRNLTYRYLPDNTLFPTEALKYEPYVIREALNNCIAHQDYRLGGRVQVIEFPDSVLFTNRGSFIPGTVEQVIIQDAPQEYYRNGFLAQAMVNLNLIDTQGGGIKRMFSLQMKRYFPLPDYDLTEPDRVKVRIFGKVLDENYSRLLKLNNDLDLQTVIMLDRIQKGIAIEREDAKKLKKFKLVEGRYPSLFVSSPVAILAGQKAEYIRNRPFDDAHYKKMVIDYIKKFGRASKQDIETLLLPKLSDALTENQKRNKIRNMLHLMAKREGTIVHKGGGRRSEWHLVDEKQAVLDTNQDIKMT